MPARPSRSRTLRRRAPTISAAIGSEVVARARRLTDHIARVLPHSADRHDAGLDPDLLALTQALIDGNRSKANRLCAALETHLASIGLALAARS
jgi:hypothetical protein